MKWRKEVLGFFQIVSFFNYIASKTCHRAHSALAEIIFMNVCNLYLADILP